MPSDTIGYYVGQRLAAEHPDRCLLSANAGGFDLDGFALAGKCTLALSPAMHAEILHWWEGPSVGLKHRAENAWFGVTWDGERLGILLVDWQNGRRYFLLADARQTAERFAVAVFALSAQGHVSVLVFESNHWRKDDELLRDIRSATFDNLILDAALKQEVRANLARFFASEAAYKQYDVPWRLHDGAIPHFADQTEGFSFAYLKELVVSATMRWIDSREHGTMAEWLSEQLTILQDQIAVKPSRHADVQAGKGRQDR